MTETRMFAYDTQILQIGNLLCHIASDTSFFMCKIFVLAISISYLDIKDVCWKVSILELIIHSNSSKDKATKVLRVIIALVSSKQTRKETLSKNLTCQVLDTFFSFFFFFYRKLGHFIKQQRKKEKKKKTTTTTWGYKGLTQKEKVTKSLPKEQFYPPPV